MRNNLIWDTEFIQTNQSDIVFLQWVQEKLVVRKQTSSQGRYSTAFVPLVESQAVMKKVGASLLSLYPVKHSLRSALHDLIKRCGTPALFEKWRKARWKTTYTRLVTD